MNQSEQRYHHGDLRSALLSAATRRIDKHGVDSISLRKLAEDVGVSRTAPYHHFTDKNSLLSAIAAQGFRQWHHTARTIFETDSLSPAQRFRQFIHEYVGYAADHPQMYELMFGRTLWQQQSATEDLKAVAYPCFQFQVDMTRYWQQSGLLPCGPEPLRLAQVTWGTLHGIARLLIDGIYADRTHVEQMCDTAAQLFMQASTYRE